MLPNYVLKNRDLIVNHGQEFKKIFGLPINKFIDPMTGFDIIAFDDWLETPDGESTRDQLIAKYGERAAELVEGLL